MAHRGTPTMAHHATPCHTMSHHATPCHTIAHHATPCHTMSHHITPCHTIPHHATPCHTMPHHVTPCHTMPHHATPCHTMPHHVTPCHTISHHVTPCHTMSPMPKAGAGISCNMHFWPRSPHDSALSSDLHLPLPLALHVLVAAMLSPCSAYIWTVISFMAPCQMRPQSCWIQLDPARRR